MNKHIIRSISLAVLAALMLAVGAALAQSTVDWWVIASGGGISSGGSAVVNMTFGQPFTGPSNAGSVALGAGYWGGIETNHPTVVALRHIAAHVDSPPWGPVLFFIGLGTLITYNRIQRKRKNNYRDTTQPLK